MEKIMSGRLLVATITFGEKYDNLSKLSHPTIKSYADKIGADFLVINEKKISKEHIHFEKFQIYNLLTTYERIIFIDTDVLVREDTPNLFDIIPKNKLGLFNEGFLERFECLSVICNRYGYKLQEDWNGDYYNTGVMVISRIHRDLFKPPEQQIVIGGFYEQDYINMMIYLTKTDVCKLEYPFNRMSCVDNFVGQNRHASYIIHYAGCPVDPYPIMKMDKERWEKDSPLYEYKRNILITLEGGLGDVIDAEPVIRYVAQKSYPNENIVVFTAPQYNKVIEHINGIKIINDFDKLDPDTAYYRVSTYKDMWGSSWRYMNQNLMHVTDFSSMLTIRKILPLEDKEIILKLSDQDIIGLNECVGDDIDYNNLVLLHPGLGWESKTFPVSWWEDIIDKLIDNGHQVGIIGKYIDDTLGVLDINIRDGVIDLRNILGLGELFAVISKAKVLITNDSSPVHIACAFDNWIVFIPTCKHPDNVLAPRNGDKYYKTIVTYKELMDSPSDAVPTLFHGKICNTIPENKTIYDFIPSTEDLVSQIEENIFRV